MQAVCGPRRRRRSREAAPEWLVVGAQRGRGEAPRMTESGVLSGCLAPVAKTVAGRNEAGSDGDQPADREAALNDGGGPRESPLPVCSCCRLRLVVLERDRRHW